MAKVRFQPSGLEVEIRVGQTLFQLGWTQDVGLASACVGKGTCGLCRVKVVSGHKALSPYNPVEEKHLGNLYHLTNLRLSCQCEIIANETIEVEVRSKKKRRDA